MRNTRLTLNTLALLVIAFLGIAGVAIAVGSGWTTHTGEKLPADPDASKIADCSGLDAIFCDGFEHGNWSAWASQPCDVPAINLPTPTP